MDIKIKTVTPDIAKKFCELCNWTYECWMIHKLVFDDNDCKDETIGKAKYFTSKLSFITLEYVLLQICKLHDKDKSSISINYIVKNSDWGADTEQVLRASNHLEELFEEIKPARNKLIAHNDLKMH